MTSFLATVGSAALATAGEAGRMALLFARICHRLVPGFDITEIVRTLHRMAVRSVPIVVVTALFTGALMVMQTAPLVRRVGADGFVAQFSGFGILREVAPLLTALMVSGRVGANNTAELGTMVVTEQIDALRALAIDPIAYVVVPRVIGIVVTLCAMTVYADVLALVGAAVTSTGLLPVTLQSFYGGLTSGFLRVGDVGNGLVKSVLFGMMIALSSCHYGLTTTGGAPGVGRSVMRAVVTSAAGVFALDYLLSFLFP